MAAGIVAWARGHATGGGVGERGRDLELERERRWGERDFPGAPDRPRCGEYHCGGERDRRRDGDGDRDATVLARAASGWARS